MYWQNAFVKILSKTSLLRQRSSGSRKDNPIMVDFGYTNNAIRNQKLFKAIANGNVADSGMVALTYDPLRCRKPNKEWKFKCKP